MIENHKEFQTLCSCDKELQDADTWLIESQALVEDVICRAFEYQELKIGSDGSESSVPIASKESKQMDPAGNTSVASIGFQSSKIQIQIFIVTHYLQNITRSIFTEITRNTKRKRLNNT